MIQILDCKRWTARRFFQRGSLSDTKAVEDAVAAILADVRARGDAAVLDYTARFDGAQLSALAVMAAEIDEAYAACEPFFLESLRARRRTSARSTAARYITVSS